MSKTHERPLIAHVVYRFDVGGLENGVVNLINRLPESSWRHAVVALTDVVPSFATRVQRADVKYLSLNKPPGHLWLHYPRLTQLFRKLRPAVVHTRNLAALEAVVPAWAAGVPVRIHGEHGRDSMDPDGARRRYHWVRRAYSPFVSRYVTVSKDLEVYLRDRVGVAPERIVQIYNGVDSDRFRAGAEARSGIDGCPFRSPEHWLVGTVGRMDHVKDQTTLAHAFVHALATKPDARRRMRLVIVGEGALRAEVEGVLNGAGARELAWFAGERDDVPQVMRGLDCFVLPSLGEGISNTILEAMASALPVIATRVGGNAELVEDGVTGHLVPAANPAALAEAMLHYFDDPASAQRHGRAARVRVERSFSLARMVDSYDQLYLVTVAAKRRASLRAQSNLPSAES
ncbi:MAG TPA: TIGR03088 family PEP-CTERM/XrtA system glycosyltransferase [Burkholderiaceae bacterium]|nr:TIGR03088 family PEP-CTERM/XrtA system glycosyltransferase [Burkholderiaceae bacterium]